MRSIRLQLSGLIGLLGGLLVCGCASSDPPAPATQPTTGPLATLKIKCADLRNRNGQLIFGVFTTEKGFPSDSTKSVNWQVKKASDDGALEFTCQLPPGVYGASILHDENSNNKMDTNLVGIPKEGYGVTNNPKPKFRGATFKESTFTLPPEGAEMTISMQYF